VRWIAKSAICKCNRNATVEKFAMTHNKGKLATAQARNEPKFESVPSSLTITRKRF